MRWYSILFCFFWSMSIIGLQTANCKHLCWVSSHQRWLNGLPLHCLHPVMNSDNHSQSCSFYEVWVQVLKVPYYEKLTFSGIWCYFGSMVLPHSYKCWKKKEKKTICAFLSETQISHSVSLQFPDEQVIFGIGFQRHWLIIWISPLPCPITAYIQCLHPPGTALPSQRSAIMLSKAACRNPDSKRH